VRERSRNGAGGPDISDDAPAAPGRGGRLARLTNLRRQRRAGTSARGRRGRMVNCTLAPLLENLGAVRPVIGGQLRPGHGQALRMCGLPPAGRKKLRLGKGKRFQACTAPATCPLQGRGRCRARLSCTTPDTSENPGRGGSCARARAPPANPPLPSRFYRSREHLGARPRPQSLQQDTRHAGHFVGAPQPEPGPARGPRKTLRVEIRRTRDPGLGKLAFR